MHRSPRDLEAILSRISGRGYRAYRDIEGSYDFGGFLLYIDRAQSDPFAPPSRARIRVPLEKAGFPDWCFSCESRTIALRDFLARRLYEESRERASRPTGTGNSGLVVVDRPGQEVLETSTIVLGEGFVEARIGVGLPAGGRRIDSLAARRLLLETVPSIARESLYYSSLDSTALKQHLETVEDADHLRSLLSEMGLVAFVADGSILPRKSGTDSRPLEEGAIPFESPESLRVWVDLPNRGRVSGMGIPRGITLIVGGGFHGKSTLLNALVLGVYNHVPGDGRELVVTVESAVKIRAEDGRVVRGVDVSPFISGLPFGRDTRFFSTDNASGSMSQAANIMEALEMGSTLILMDEDTCATNLMIRDERMQDLVPRDIEPITPFVDRARELYEKHHVSTVLVTGGSGDYLDIADLVICMVEYRPVDVTDKAREVIEKHPSRRRNEALSEMALDRERLVVGDGLDPYRGKKKRIKSSGTRSILFGRQEVDVSRVEQFVHEGQLRAVGLAIDLARRRMDGKKSLSSVVKEVVREVREKGLDALAGAPVGGLCSFRGFELAAAINRHPGLRVLKPGDGKG